ncbi:MAG: hypothetical protein QOH44_2073, partial [Actinomycetota bacterium]|nr:hypothetical protein [Actinomycetota bacterium]
MRLPPFVRGESHDPGADDGWRAAETVVSVARGAAADMAQL